MSFGTKDTRSDGSGRSKRGLSFGKRLLFWLALVLLSTGVTILAGEVVLRAGGFVPWFVHPLWSFHDSDPLTGHRGRKNFVGRHKTPSFEVVVAHDGAGFRRQEHQIPLDQAKHKVCVFGDSFTWGWGVGQGKVFTDQMSLLLPGFHIMNFGLSAAGTVAEYVLFRHECRDRIDPGDTVILMFFGGNDFDDNVRGRLFAKIEQERVVEVRKGQPAGLKIKRFLRDHFYLYNWLAAAWDLYWPTWVGRHFPRQALPHLNQGLSHSKAVIARHYLASFQRDCRKQGANFLAVYVPGGDEVEQMTGASSGLSAERQARRRTFFDIAQSLGIETLDLLPFFLEGRQNPALGRLAFARDHHWNEAGHALAARVIARRLAEFYGQAKPSEAPG